MRMSCRPPRGRISGGKGPPRRSCDEGAAVRHPSVLLQRAGAPRVKSGGGREDVRRQPFPRRPLRLGAVVGDVGGGSARERLE